VPPYPPSAERVLQQEVHHVGLGEELRDGADAVAADLLLALVDLVLPLRLPVLVDPAQGVTRGKDLRGQATHQALQPLLVFGSKRHTQQRVIRAEDAWEVPMSASVSARSSETSGDRGAAMAASVSTCRRWSPSSCRHASHDSRPLACLSYSR